MNCIAHTIHSLWLILRFFFYFGHTDDHETATTPAMSYTAAVASDAARAWEALCGNGNGSGADAAAATDGNNSDNWVVPTVARDAVWSEAVQASEQEEKDRIAERERREYEVGGYTKKIEGTI
jgi:hypothetical protein